MNFINIEKIIFSLLVCPIIFFTLLLFTEFKANGIFNYYNVYIIVFGIFLIVSWGIAGILILWKLSNSLNDKLILAILFIVDVILCVMLYVNVEDGMENLTTGIGFNLVEVGLLTSFIIGSILESLFTMAVQWMKSQEHNQVTSFEYLNKLIVMIFATLATIIGVVYTVFQIIEAASKL